MNLKQTKEIIVYGHSFCGAIPTVRKILEAADAHYKYVDITFHPEASRHVAKINDGNYSVPTLVFPDKSTLTEPSPAALLEKLETMGYSVDVAALKSARQINYFRSPAFVILILILLYAVLRVLGIF